METPTAPQGLAGRAGEAFAAYRAGDAQRLGDLVELLNPLLWHTARAQGASSSTAEDAVQTAWLRLVDHAERIEDPRAVLGWLVVTVRREAWRLVGRERREIDVDELPESVETTAGPELTALDGADSSVLWHHVAGLPLRCQQLLRVIAFADRPDYAGVANALGMPVGSIGPTRGRCLQKLRTALAGDPEWGTS